MQWIIYIVVALVAGGAAFWLGKARGQKESASLQQIAALEQEKKDVEQRCQTALQQWASSQGAYETLSKQLQTVQAEKAALQDELKKQQEALAAARAQQAVLATEKKNLAEERARLLDTYKSQFETLATDILNKQTQLFKQGNQEELGHLLSPLKAQLEEQLRDFKAKIDSYAKDQREDKTNLNSKIQLLETMTRSFISSIHNQSHARGLWGEESLRQILASSGLQKDVTYFEQTSQDDKRTDFIVRLPNNKLIVIDSKTVFSHYDAFIQATSEETRKAELKAHVAAMFDTIHSLGTKAYQKSIGKICKKLNIEESGDPVEMVLMYVHPEGALSCALEGDSSLLAYAKEYNVVLVSQSTLMGALQLVDALWLNFRDEEKNQEIRTAAEKFIAAFGNFLALWIKVGSRLEEALEAHRKTAALMAPDGPESLSKLAQDIADLQPSKINEKTAKAIAKGGYDFTGERRRE